VKKIFETVSGSRLYGTQIDKSDTDIKGVYLPSRESILLQNSEKLLSEKFSNENGIYERELIPFATFLNLLAKTDTRVIDMFFAPRSMWLMEPDPIFFKLMEMRHTLISRECKSMLGYCRNFAYRFGDKATSIRALDTILAVLSKFGLNDKLETKITDIKKWCDDSSDIVKHWIQIDDHSIVVSGIQVSLKKTAAEATASFYKGKLVSEWRVKNHYDKIKIDWKDIMHGVRITHQLMELLETGVLIFPRLNAEYLLRIRLGEIPIKEISFFVDLAIARIEELVLTSRIFVTEVQQNLLDEIVLSEYSNVVGG
jgi:hypothetical protein